MIAYSHYKCCKKFCPAPMKLGSRLNRRMEDAGVLQLWPFAADTNKRRPSKKRRVMLPAYQVLRTTEHCFLLILQSITVQTVCVLLRSQ